MKKSLTALFAALLLIVSGRPVFAADDVPTTGGMWDFFGRWFGWIWQGFRDLAAYIGGLLRNFAQFLYKLLQPLWDFLGGLMYLLTSLLDVLILVVQMVLLFLQVVLAVVGGVIRTVVSLVTWDPSQVAPEVNHFANGTGLFFDLLNSMGGNVVAQVLQWAIWLLLAWAILRLFAGGGKTTGE
jgi:hypothetical protein